MKKLLKTLSVIMCAILLTTSVVPNLPVNSVETVYAATKKPKLNYTKKTIYEGKTFTLKVSGTKNKVKWSTSNKKIATVNSKGVVKGIKKGNATITAKIDKKSLKCKVEVKSKVVNVEKIVLNKESIELKIGQSTKISATIKPSNATNKTLKWKSDNKNVATVDNKGLVKGVSDGTAIITVSSANGIKEDCVIDVVKNDEQISEPSNESEEPSVVPSEEPSIIEPSVPEEPSSSLQETLEKNVESKLDLVDTECRVVMDTIYNSWYFQIYNADDYYDGTIIPPYTLATGITEESMRQTVLDFAGRNDDIAIVAAIRVLGVNMLIVHNYYDRDNKLFKFEDMKKLLDDSKEIIKGLPDTSSKKQSLKNYYNAVNKYYEFVYDPSGNFAGLSAKRQSLEEAVNDAKQELEW